ncbi:hypothetical protein [Pelagicoccus sp. SDUM812002]|uniref:hypothetical protein n=1 Tax=Pelagicoccus sp. SDUM812002 TaxID=3041266 RepID=UPI00280D4CCC|nr:hypothetical protein [Pelagicoccus sp. SDUM812002]MDQ8185500.1 hypothetical protein [Pelagicoccus sp. SDUM812002]
MFGIKFTAILLITAIFNPLCCCLDLSAMEPQPEHSCCSATPDAANSETEHHTQAECPHESEKNSQISEPASAHDSIVKSQISQAALLFALEFLQRDSGRETTPLFTLDRTSLPPTSPDLEEYCVYIL